MTARSLTFLAFLILGVGASGAAAQQGAANPHGELPEGMTCSDCHTSEGWTPLRSDLAFDHAETGFALDGRHREVTCATCHLDLTFADAAADQDDCASCHLDVHQGTIARNCAACHTTMSFNEMPPGVVHPADFPLEGAHLQTTCESCHTDDLGGAYAPLDRECASCHMSDYVSTPLVDHQALGFSTDCTECHSMLDFRDVAFDHFTVSGGFELIGQHAGIECTACHSLPGGGLPVVPAGPEDCVACHISDYEDEHGGSGFPTDCLQCHTTDDWDDADFDHAAATGFQLIANHDLLACRECHVDGSSETLFDPSGPEDCIACHLADYESEHGGSGFPTTCTDCHAVTDWGGATFDHLVTTGFELIPNHDQLQCSQCHVGSTSETIWNPSGPQDCYSCHITDYQNQHAGSGFSTDCTDCHQATTWDFNHDFPIFSGPHVQGAAWNDCAECHTVPGSPEVFSCFGCHGANQTQNQHQGVNNYQYDSPSCLSCHPNGRS